MGYWMFVEVELVLEEFVYVLFYCVYIFLIVCWFFLLWGFDDGCLVVLVFFLGYEKFLFWLEIFFYVVYYFLMLGDWVFGF